MEEEVGFRKRYVLEYKLLFELVLLFLLSDKYFKVVIIWEEGSNGDREMVVSFYMVEFEVWDVIMNDLCSGLVKLDDFCGVVFVGGFSYVDVFGFVKGWVVVCNINVIVCLQLDVFFFREDIFSLGVCNGCQLMGLLGWVGQDIQIEGRDDLKQGVCFIYNILECFEFWFVIVFIQFSFVMMLCGMEGFVLGIWVVYGEG